MPIWKGKKTENSSRTKMCPKCHGTNLKYGFLGGLLLGQKKLECSDCGYAGYVYIDVNPNDHFEDEIEAEFLQENPNFLKTRKSAVELAAVSLEHKWLPDQKLNPHTLREWCPFCEDVSVICKICKCPPEICGDHATKGLIGKLNELYDDQTPLSDVDSTIYMQIVKGFQQLVKEGKEKK